MRLVLFLLLLLSVSACTPPHRLYLERKNFHDLPNWQEDNHKEALQVFIKSCQKFDDKGWKKFLTQLANDKQFDKKKFKCEIASSSLKNQTTARKFFETNFYPYLVKNNAKSEGLFTGYYDVALTASRVKKGKYIYPIYGKPSMLEKGKKFYTREEIEKGALKGLGLELAYTDDPIRLFSMHIQGSGTLLFDDNTRQKITYAATNGHKYSSIGRYLWKVERIDKDRLNAEFIWNYLKNNPFKQNEILNHNKSYVFFRLNKDIAPIGAQQLPLTKERSLAIDNKFIPYGAPLFVTTTYPINKNPFRKLMIAQDRGGAIKGPVRGDIFFGAGGREEKNAFYMKHKGSYYVLIPNSFVIDKDKRISYE